MVSIAIMSILIALFIPTFDNYKNRQDGFLIAQQIIQDIQSARTYAIAPDNLKSPLNKDTKKIRVEISKTSYSVSQVEEINKKPKTSINSRSIDSDWKLVSLNDDAKENNFLLNNGFLMGFDIKTGSITVYNNSQEEENKVQSGFEASQTLDKSTFDRYLVPKNKTLGSQCQQIDGCVKILINVLSGLVKLEKYPQ